MNVSENRKKGEGNKRNATLDWKMLFQAIGQSIIILDAHNQIIAANDATIRITGKSLEELLGKKCYEVLHAPKHPPGACPFKRLLATGGAESVKEEIEALGGVFLVSCTPVYDDKGRLDKIIHMATDISERKQAETRLLESEEKYRTIMEASPDAIAISRMADGLFIEVNDAYCQLVGYSRRELIGRTSLSFDLFVNPEDRQRLIRRLKDTGMVRGFELTHRKKDGSLGEGSLSAKSIIYQEKECLLGVTRDISERKRGEALLKKEALINAKMADLAQIVLQAETLQEIAERILEAAREITASPDGYVGYLDPETNQMIFSTLTQVIRDPSEGPEKNWVFKEFSGFSGWLLKNDQSLLTNDPANDPRLSGGVPAGQIPLERFLSCPALMGETLLGQIALANAGRDYTDADLVTVERIASLYALGITRLRAQEALRRSEEKFFKLFHLSPAAISLSTQDEGRFMEVNNAFLRLNGYAREEVIGRTAAELGLWPYPEERERMFSHLREKGAIRDWEIKRRTKSGAILDILFSADTLDIAGAKYTLAVSQDISERKRLEKTLKKSEERYRLLADNLTDNIWTMDLNLRFTFVSPSVERLFGYTIREALVLELTDLLTETSLALTREVFEDEMVIETREDKDLGRARSLDLEIKKKDGSFLWTECTVSFLRDPQGQPVGILGVTRDISARKEAEREVALLQEQLRQAHKMEAVGRLAGGIAHDFNNILTVIKGYSELALLKIPQEDPLKTALEEINRAGERAANLTHRLLAFSRKQIMALKVTDLNETLKDLEKMLHGIIGEDVELITILHPHLWPVKIDPSQIDQAIINLAVNARDAMPLGGKLILETANVELNEEYSQTHIDVKTGQYVMIAVSDTGTGIPPDIKEHIFEPFFTTKKGAGTGLGLSMVYGIVKQSGGHIFVYSEPGQGTTFKIYLPRIKETEEVCKKE